MANGFVGSDTWTLDWQFWFLEAIVWTSLGLAAVLAVPAVRRLERLAPFAWALGLVAVAAVLRFALVGVEAGPTERYTGTIVLWCFALGWAAARARTTVQRGLVTVLAVLLTVGFFGDLWRELFVVAGDRACSSGCRRSACPRGWPRPAASSPRHHCRSISRTGRSTRTWRWSTRCSRRSPHSSSGSPTTGCRPRSSTASNESPSSSVGLSSAASRGCRSTSMAALIAAPISTEIDST